MIAKESRRDYFLRKAREAREAAKDAGDTWIREALQDVARNYEMLAAQEAEAGAGEQLLSRKRAPL
jgi:hypothetical protein